MNKRLQKEIQGVRRKDSVTGAGSPVAQFPHSRQMAMIRRDHGALVILESVCLLWHWLHVLPCFKNYNFLSCVKAA